MTPAQALGHDLLSRGFRVEIITDRRGMKYESMFGAMKMHQIRAGTLGTLKGIADLALGFLQALWLVAKLRPAVVIGFGGYPSVPGVFAAQLFGIPTIIHEQNAIIGKANAMLAPKAKQIALSLPLVSGLDESDKIRCTLTGNPVRPEIAALYARPYPGVEDNGALRIFVVGGSLGAHVFSDVVPKALSRLLAPYKSRLRIVQQCRAENLDITRDAYEKAGIEAELAVFFNDMAAQLEKAHLVIARSGASTVAEVTTAGRPAIFVPYPHHKDQQQKMNADCVADAGGAWVMSESGFTAEALLARIETFLQNPQILFRAAEKAASCGKPDAARKLGNLVTEIASGWNE